jgi:hypothetical protein
MKINLKDIQVPLEKTVSYANGQVEISLAKMTDKKAGIYKSFMSTCASDDKALVDTSDMDEESTMKTCAVSFDKMKNMLMEESESGELTPKQKQLPPALQKAILEKMKKSSNPDTEKDMEENDASGQSTKMLSKNDQAKETFDGETLKINK